MPRRPTVQTRETAAEQVLEPPEASLLDLLDRLLEKGVMANGDVMIGVAGVDLIYVRLAALLCAADRVLPRDPLASAADRKRLRHRRPGARRAR